MMSLRRLIGISLLGILTVVSLLTAVPLNAQTDPDGTPTGIDLDRLEIGDSVEYELYAGPLNTAAFLAPDGQHFLYVSDNRDDRQLCLYDTFSTNLSCSPLDNSDHYNPASFRWSADGHRVAFINKNRVGEDSDLMSFDSTTGVIMRLTNNGSTASPLATTQAAGDAPGYRDIAPRFSLDSTRVFSCVMNA